MPNSSELFRTAADRDYLGFGAGQALNAREIANIAQLVAQYFDGDASKTALWFRTRNPLFGNLSPRDMVRFGRYERLRRFVTEALGQNAALPQPREARHAPARSAAITAKERAQRTDLRDV